MNLLRTLLIVLLAALLPMRGAMAATFNGCAAGSPALHAAAEARHAEHSLHAHHTAMQPVAADSDAGHPHPAAQACAGKAGCLHCAAFCCASALPSQPAQIAAPAALATLVFPALTVPSADFPSTGPDRPPRPR